MIDELVNNLISNFFGEVWIFGIALIGIFILVSLAIGLNFSSAIMLSLPISLMIASSGFFSGYGWIADAVLVIVGLAYGLVIVRLLSR
jgi:hypothetical protein